MSTTPDRAGAYSTLAMTLHWLFVLIFLVMFPLGYIMTGLELSPTKLAAVSWHKSIGITALSLAVLRLGWRLVRPPPPLPADLPPPQKLGARIVHWLLYGVIFALPMSGWLMSSAAGFTVKPFGLFALPNLVDKDKPTFRLLVEVHEILGYVLLGLIALHVGAALYHYFVRRDGILGRMLPLARIG
ncbi:MAG: cytochrome b [Hyphomicrobiaceae bacterium]